MRNFIEATHKKHIAPTVAKPIKNIAYKRA